MGIIQCKTASEKLALFLDKSIHNMGKCQTSTKSQFSTKGQFVQN